MKNMTCLLLAGTAALSLAACGSESAPSQTSDGIVTKITKPVELQFWHSISNPVHAEVLDKLIAQFNDTVGKEKQITVTATFNGSSSDLYSNVIAAIKAETAPDVTLALRPYVADYLQTDLVVDLTPYIQDETVGMPDYEDIFEGLRNGGIPAREIGDWDSDELVLIQGIMDAFFEENGLTVPATWDELIETSKKIHEITGAPAFGWDNLAGSFMTLVKQYGGRYTDPEGNIYFAEEDSETALKVLNLWKENVGSGIWRTAGEDMFFSGPFANEQIPMYVGDSVEASYIPAKNPELKWSTAPIPQVSDDTAANLSAGHVITALNQSGNPEKAYASYELIKFLTSKEANLAVVTAGTGYLPIRQSVADSEEYKAYVADGHDFLTAAVEQNDRYFYEPAFTNDTTTSSAVTSAVRTMMQEVAENGTDPQTALDNLKQTVGLN